MEKGFWYKLLLAVFVAIPVLAGLDKLFFHLVFWQQYLTPGLAGSFFGSQAFLNVVGVVEAAAGLLVWWRPKIGGNVLGAWFVLLSIILLMAGSYENVLKDLGLAAGAFVLAGWDSKRGLRRR